MVEISTLLTIGFSGLNLVLVFILEIFLLVSFIRKKTVGTMMLFLSYLFFGITSLISVVVKTLLILGYDSQILEAFVTIGPLILYPAFAFLYIFASRHILKDSEIMRTLIFGMIMVFWGLASALVGWDMFLFPEGSRFFSSRTYLTSEIYTATYITFILIIQIAVSIYVTGRVGFRSLRLAAKSDQPVRRRGLQTIGIGVLLYLLGGMLSAFDSSLTASPALLIIVVSLRGIVFTFAYIGMYLGWIMPTWYRKMIRKRSWFELQYKELSKSV